MLKYVQANVFSFHKKIVLTLAFLVVEKVYLLFIFEVFHIDHWMFYATYHLVVIKTNGNVIAKQLFYGLYW